MEQFTKGSIEFLTVAIEYCKYLEHANEKGDDFLPTLSKLLSLLYMKAAMVQVPENEYDVEVISYVRESDYDAIRTSIESLLGENDRYLTASHPDIELSDTVISASISEDLADVYQSVKDFEQAAKLGDSDIMNAALQASISYFKQYWGERLISALCAIHKLVYK